MTISTVRAVNRLTKRWAAAQPPDGGNGTVFTAAGVWPLLALLTDGAGGAAREELARALGIPAGAAAGAARELLAALAGVRGLRTATGLWVRDALPLEEAWRAKLPAGALGTLTGDAGADTAVLDAWASDRTGGLIERMPVSLQEDTRFVLASALALRLKWIRPFYEEPGHVAEGPWADRLLPLLVRSTSLLDRVRVAHGPAGPVTLLEVVGDTGVDVHLVLGEPDAPAGETLGAGIDVVTRALPATGADLLPEGKPGPGLSVTTVPAVSRRPRLTARTVAFDVRAEHDLLEQARLFGLESASDSSRGHFPGISAEPLAIGSARQAALARFGAEGFEAAAVTAVMAVAGSAPPALRYRVRWAEVRFDRPFGFLAVHRASRLVLAAGWISEPGTVSE
ncbi:serpin family protein [Streptomyces sp. NPDC059193]|uniref:serpin family protein n=1 Tax=Streptomyces sp. NPDC059193 TaxID=3346763 RepID=UPI00367917EB